MNRELNTRIEILYKKKIHNTTISGYWVYIQNAHNTKFKITAYEGDNTIYVLNDAIIGNIHKNILTKILVNMYNIFGKLYVETPDMYNRVSKCKSELGNYELNNSTANINTIIEKMY